MTKDERAKHEAMMAVFGAVGLALLVHRGVGLDESSTARLRFDTPTGVLDVQWRGRDARPASDGATAAASTTRTSSTRGRTD